MLNTQNEILFTLTGIIIFCINYLTPQLTSEAFKNDDLDTLKGVFLFMRHGIRAPSGSYPLDPNINNSNILYPNGKLQLTAAGIQQAYTIGSYLYGRYGTFITRAYREKRTFLRSSHAQRCIDTLSIVSKVLWRPQLFNNSWWQPMIFSLPKPIDQVCYEDPYCPLGDQEEANNLNSDDAQQFNNESQNKKLYEYVANNTGLSATMNSVTLAFDVVRCEKLNGFALPSWCTPHVYEKMGHIYTEKLKFKYSSGKSQRLRIGPLFGDFKKNMDLILNPPSNTKPKNVFLYTTHDVKIAVTLLALGLPLGKYPPFLATLIFELHRVNGKSFVRVYYLYQTETLPYQIEKLDLPECNEHYKHECTYNGFIYSLRELMPVNWKQECGIDDSYDAFAVAETGLGQTECENDNISELC